MSRVFALPALLFLLAGCTGDMLPGGESPEAQLQEARVLYAQTGRPGKAEQLILDALEKGQQSGDLALQALAHREYAYFLSTAGTDAIIYDPAAVQPPASPERLRRGLGEMQEASKLYEQLGMDDRLSNTALGEARILHMLGETAATCAALDRSEAAGERRRLAVPGVTPTLPPGIASFSELIGHFRTEYGCPPR